MLTAEGVRQHVTKHSAHSVLIPVGHHGAEFSCSLCIVFAAGHNYMMFIIVLQSMVYLQKRLSHLLKNIVVCIYFEKIRSSIIIITDLGSISACIFDRFVDSIKNTLAATVNDVGQAALS